MKIAVLGWGSLIWDPRNLKIKQRHWFLDGPSLPIEFARISSRGRLTLVIYPPAKKIQTLWNWMEIEDLNHAIENLTEREDTVKDKIGFFKSHDHEIHSQFPSGITDEIKNWAIRSNIDAVIWTDLEAKLTGIGEFNEENIIRYLRTLNKEKRQAAKEYIRNAPIQVKTKMREIIEKRLGWYPTEYDKMAKNIAIKCTYNNGEEGVFVGFNGTCSEEIIKWNIEHGRVWCNQKECDCKKYYNKGFKGKRPEDPCMESVLFREWEYGAGTYHKGKRAGTPIRLSNVDKGKIAILTTRFPGDKEENRRIIGFYKISQVTNKPGEETKMMADNKFRIRLPMEEAKELYFWDYYSTKGGTRWNTGLIRYLDDKTVARILSDLRETIRDKKDKLMIGELIDKDFKGITPAPALGPRIRKSGNRAKRVAIARKYGSGGEGIEHKKLKEWVAKNPEAIGITGVVDAKIEYLFPSGDVADILFIRNGGNDVAVEIETTDSLPGCYQALKYRVLRCAELSRDVNSTDVEAVLVAWEAGKETKNFCSKYGIRFIEKKL